VTREANFVRFFPELAKQVRGIFVNCVGEVDPDISTMELLKRIELRMETLTQDLERLPAEKVKIAQRVIFLHYYFSVFFHFKLYSAMLKLIFLWSYEN